MTPQMRLELLKLVNRPGLGPELVIAEARALEAYVMGEQLAETHGEPCDPPRRRGRKPRALAKSE